MTSTMNHNHDEADDPVRPLGKDLSVEMLNAALYPALNGWERKRARKNHVDLFGQTVRSGQFHYVRQVGMGFAEIERMSEDSMNRMLDAIFLGNWGLADYARKALLIRRRQQEQELDEYMRRSQGPAALKSASTSSPDSPA